MWPSLFLTLEKLFDKAARVPEEFRVVLVSDVNVPAELCLWLQSQSCSMTFDYSPVHALSGFALVITDVAARPISCPGSLQSDIVLWTVHGA